MKNSGDIEKDQSCSCEHGFHQAKLMHIIYILQVPEVNFSLKNKIAIVTGGSKGIGKAIATAFAENGADVCLAARGVEALQKAKEEISKTGRKIHVVQADMGKEGEFVL